MYKTIIQVFQENEQLKNEFEKFLLETIENGVMTPTHVYKPRIDPAKTELSDQAQAVYEYFTRLHLIIEQYCGWGKSFIVSFISYCLAIFMSQHRQIIKELNGNKPIVIGNSAPLTSLSIGNQFGKDLFYLFPLIMNKNTLCNIKFINANSGKNAAVLNENNENTIFNDICKEYNYNDIQKQKYKSYFSNIVDKQTTDMKELEYEILNNKELDLAIIYFCDASLSKILNFSSNFIDIFNQDEAHVNFLSGNDNIDTNAYNARKIFIENNPYCITRDYTATPMWIEGEEKSTWNIKLFGKEQQYMSYRRALELNRVLPIKLLIKTYDKTGNIITYDKFCNMKKKQQIQILYSAIIDCNKAYHQFKTNEKISRTLVFLDGVWLKNIYAFYNNMQKYKEQNLLFTDPQIQSKYKDDIIYQYLADGNIIISTTSEEGVIILTNDLTKNKKFASPIELINFLNDKKNDFYLDKDMLIFNIKQLRTGHDINLFNNEVWGQSVSKANFEQGILRTGRLNGIKILNIINILSFLVPPEISNSYFSVLERLDGEIGAYEKEPSKFIFGDENDKTNSPYLYNIIIQAKINAKIELEKSIVKTNKTASDHVEIWYQKWLPNNRRKALQLLEKMSKEELYLQYNNFDEYLVDLRLQRTYNN